MGDVKITSVYMLMEMLILISLYMKTCSIALLLVFPNLVTYVDVLMGQEFIMMKDYWQLFLCRRCVIIIRYVEYNYVKSMIYNIWLSIHEVNV